MSEPYRLINDETGWTVVGVLDYPACASVRVPVFDGYGYDSEGYWVPQFGQVVYKRSGETDAQGRTIFRTREQ